MCSTTRLLPAPSRKALCGGPCAQASLSAILISRPATCAFTLISRRARPGDVSFRNPPGGNRQAAAWDQRERFYLPWLVAKKKPQKARTVNVDEIGRASCRERV